MKRFLILCLSSFLGLCSLFGEQEVKQVVILGSGPAGLTSAIYTSRAGLSSLVIEGEEPGGQIALSYTVENFPGFPEGVSGEELGKRMRDQAIRFGTQILPGTVVSADLSHRPFSLKLDSGKVVLAETLILASGASPKWLGLPSEKALIGKGVGSCAVCDAALYAGKETVVVGGGDSALQDALLLAKHAKKVSLVHRRDSFKGSKYLQNQVMAADNIEVIYNTVVKEIKDAQGMNVTGVMLQDLKTEKTRFFPCDGVFIAIGHAPNTKLFKDQLDLSEEGYVVTAAQSTTTKVPGVFVAGDIADSKYRQAITAAGAGCKAGLDAYHFIQQNPYKFRVEPKEELIVQKAAYTTVSNQGIVQATSRNFQDLINDGRPLILDVYSNNCRYCRQLYPILETLSQEQGDRYQFAKLNIDQEGSLMRRYNIKGLPTILFFKGGKEVGRKVGFMNKGTFESEIKRYFE